MLISEDVLMLRSVMSYSQLINVLISLCSHQLTTGRRQQSSSLEEQQRLEQTVCRYSKGRTLNRLNILETLG